MLAHASVEARTAAVGLTGLVDASLHPVNVASTLSFSIVSALIKRFVFIPGISLDQIQLTFDQSCAIRTSWQQRY